MFYATTDYIKETRNLRAWGHWGSHYTQAQHWCGFVKLEDWNRWMFGCYQVYSRVTQIRSKWINLIQLMYYFQSVSWVFRKFYCHRHISSNGSINLCCSNEYPTYCIKCLNGKYGCYKKIICIFFFIEKWKSHASCCKSLSRTRCQHVFHSLEV